MRITLHKSWVLTFATEVENIVCKHLQFLCYTYIEYTPPETKHNPW